MELKNIAVESVVEYATKKEISEEKLKKYIPAKWKISGITAFIFSMMMRSKAVMAVSTSGDVNKGEFMGIITLEPIYMPESEPRLSVVLENAGIFAFALGLILTITYYIKKKKGSENLKKLKIITIVLLSLGIISLILLCFFNVFV